MMRVLAALAVLTAVPLSAHTQVSAAFRDIVSTAGLIARGHVTDVRAITVPNRGIETVATVAVDHVVKGAATAFVSVHIPGGVLGSQRVVVIGAPTFRTGDHAVFFLKRRDDNGWVPVGRSMGIYRVHRDERTRQPMVHPPVVPGITASVGRVVRGDSRRQTMTVTEFESLVRLVAATAPRGAQ